MKIIIVGDNLTAYAIAKSLDHEAHDITMIGNNALRIKHIEETLDIQTVFGSYTHVETYEIAECVQADIIIAVTEVPEIDLVVSMIGINTYQVALMITIIQGSIYRHRQNIIPPQANPSQQQIWISPAELVSNHIIDLINHPDYHEVVTIHDTMCIARLQITAEKMAYCKTWLKYLRSKKFPGTLTTVIRNNKHIDQPKALQLNDHVLFTCTKEQLNAITADLNPQKRIKSIIIAGISNITQTLIHKIASNIQLKIIEKDIHLATDFAEKNNHVTILEGDINDAELLISEKIDQTDAFVALSNDDEDNLVAALQAKRHKVNTVTSLVHRPEIAPIIEENDIVSIEPQKMLVDEVFSITHKDIIIKKHSLHRNTGEILCCRIPKHLHRKNIDTLQINEKCKILHWQRKNKTRQPQRSTIMHYQDHITFYLNDLDAVIKLQQLLKTPKQSLFGFLKISH